MGNGENRFLNNTGATFVARLPVPTFSTAGSAATLTNDGTVLMGLDGPRWSPDLAALGNMETGQKGLYKHVFNELNTEGYIAPLHTQYLGAASFNERLFECRWSGGKDPAYGVDSITECIEREKQNLLPLRAAFDGYVA